MSSSRRSNGSASLFMSSLGHDPNLLHFRTTFERGHCQVRRFSNVAVAKLVACVSRIVLGDFERGSGKGILKEVLPGRRAHIQQSADSPINALHATRCKESP